MAKTKKKNTDTLSLLNSIGKSVKSGKSVDWPDKPGKDLLNASIDSSDEEDEVGAKEVAIVEESTVESSTESIKVEEIVEVQGIPEDAMSKVEQPEVNSTAKEDSNADSFFDDLLRPSDNSSLFSDNHFGSSNEDMPFGMSPLSPEERRKQDERISARDKEEATLEKPKKQEKPTKVEKKKKVTPSKAKSKESDVSTIKSLDSAKDAENSQIKSRQRVSDLGEVFTNPREVNAMLDLASDVFKEELGNLTKTFLEPSCGTGNFLVEITSRKLNLLNKLNEKYSFNREQYETHLLVTVGSIYGIDIMPDNCEESRTRMIGIINEYYAKVYSDLDLDVVKGIHFILENNIILGNGLSGMQVNSKGEDTENEIIFSQWGINEENPLLIERQDYPMNNMLLMGGSCSPIAVYEPISYKELACIQPLKDQIVGYEEPQYDSEGWLI